MPQVVPTAEVYGDLSNVASGLPEMRLGSPPELEPPHSNPLAAHIHEIAARVVQPVHLQETAALPGKRLRSGGDGPGTDTGTGLHRVELADDEAPVVDEALGIRSGFLETEFPHSQIGIVDKSPPVETAHREITNDLASIIEVAGDTLAAAEIGRASCRERV